MTGEIVAGFGKVRVLVVGDVMLDRFIYAHASRISPEAPVPVLTVEREEESLGGAGNVARNIASLGGRATLIAGIGADAAGARLRELLQAEPGIEDRLIRSDASPTTEKIRYIADRQQVMRADREAVWTQAGKNNVLAEVKGLLADHHALVISDYAKGFLPAALTAELIALGRQAGKPVIADPKGTDFSRYDGASVMTPNRLEAQTATGGSAEDDVAAAAAAEKILSSLPKLGAVLITRGPAGLTLLARGQTPVHVSGARRDVFDVSGAGDTAVAALALALAAGSDLEGAARLANTAAGIAVTMVGTAAVSADAMMEELQSRQLESAEKKIVSSGRAQQWRDRWRAQSRRVGFTNGCFDLIHPGHVFLLAQARAKCDRLVVGLNSDASVKKLKGAGRPIQDMTARAIVLASLATVDLVVIFDEDTPDGLIRLLKPDVLVKGADYKRGEVVGADFVSSYGGEVILAELMPERSTSSLITRARE